MTDLNVSVTYSFSGWQANNPAAPLPAQEVDDQIAVLVNRHNALVSALGDVRRADGKIQNGAVGQESLDDNLLGFFNDTLIAVRATDIATDAFATQAEAQAAATNVKLMSPLLTRYTLDQLRPYVSQTQAAAGVDTIGVLNPLRASQHFSGRFNTALLAYAGSTVGAGATASQTVTVVGAAPGQPVLVAPPTAAFPAGLIFFAWVSGSNTVTLRWYNATGSAQAIAAATYKVMVVKV